MKKLICVLLALTMLLAFAGCEDKSDSKDAEIKDSGKQEANNPPAEGEKVTGEEETTEDVREEGEPVIITVRVFHSDGEESSNRMTTTEMTLMEALRARNFISEDMLTVDGERVAEDASWMLYIDGVSATEGWDQIQLKANSEYLFEYVSENEFGEEVGDDIGEGDVPEENVADEIPEDTTVDPEVPEA